MSTFRWTRCAVRLKADTTDTDTTDTIVGVPPTSETRTLAQWLVDSRLDDVPQDVRHEALRALVNYVGCALGGARDEAVDIALRALAPFFGPPTARILGRVERLDPLHASLMNGISSHVYDYDDTTRRTTAIRHLPSRPRCLPTRA